MSILGVPAFTIFVVATAFSLQLVDETLTLEEREAYFNFLQRYMHGLEIV
jgi:hypothetical protein